MSFGRSREISTTQFTLLMTPRLMKNGSSRRVEDAAHSIAVAEEAEKGRRALDLAASLKRRAAVLDDLLSRVARESVDLKNDIRVLNFSACLHASA